MVRFFDEIAGVARRGPRFFVPGHKGNPDALPPAFSGALHHDLTEVAGAGDLSRPTGALAESEALMARAYGSGATLYSAFGSTSCILAMLGLFTRGQAAFLDDVPEVPGLSGETGRPKVVMARGCHVSAVRALALLDLEPVWVPLADGVPRAADIAAALARSGAQTVYLTSPDYYGNMADIPAIAAVCRAHGAALLVDNAHGAYLRFYPASGAGAYARGAAPGGDLHPLTLGADATADSAHKTLPCLTPAAMLHLRNGGLAAEARGWLNLFGSTSPSYLVLESLDLAAERLNSSPPDFAACARRLARAGRAFAEAVAPCADPLKLVLAPARAGVRPEAFHAGLLAAGIAPEYYDGERLVLMASPWNTEADFAALEAALRGLAASLPRGDGAIPIDDASENRSENTPTPLPEAVCSVRAALFGKKRSLPVAEASGKVCAGLFAPCPPGVPLVVPGELITAGLAARLAAGGISQLDVLY